MVFCGKTAVKDSPSYYENNRFLGKEFDTYKVGTVANSCSTMHKIHAKEFTLDDFSHEHLLTDKCFIYPFRADGYYGGWEPKYILENVIDMLNTARELYIETKNKKYWWQMIQLLPTSYNQKRTVTLNYENLYAMSRQRESHKLNEWSGKDDPTLTNFLNFVHQLPWANELIFFE